MILPVVKFVVFTLAPFLILLWTTAPDLWSQFSTSACLVGDNPSSLLSLPDKLLISGETIVKSLTCDDLEFPTIGHAVPASTLEVVPASIILSLNLFTKLILKRVQSAPEFKSADPV
ncbi:hypothetical protein DSO57_1014444 [Entomophthora muscae]|uniref:Uncharacterized protein n=1 Tax=Entomophthora muscae TaxID=34485 RepID=A0ACC2RK63_9FUNG|nr:hypothetical protein DSO57_1014444 [Entomophthora muscae]